MSYRFYSLRQSGSPWLLALVLLSGIAAQGCSEELGPERFPTTRLTGVVMEGSKPVGGGWIEFIPGQGTVGNLRSARIAKDGSFQVDRVPVGENVIRLVNAPITIPGGAALFSRFNTPIRRKIPPQPDGPVTIDLLQEAMRYQATRPRPAARSATPSVSREQP